MMWLLAVGGERIAPIHMQWSFSLAQHVRREIWKGVGLVDMHAITADAGSLSHRLRLANIVLR
jgi:hypothetical protein